MGGWLRSAQFAETMEPQSRCKFVLPKEVWFLFCVLNRDVFTFVLLYTNKVILVRVQMDIWEKCNSYVQSKNEKWMYGEKVMENVLFYLAHWIYRKFFTIMSFYMRKTGY